MSRLVVHLAYLSAASAAGHASSSRGAEASAEAAPAADNGADGSILQSHDLGVLLITSLLPLGLVLLTEILKDRNRLSTWQSRKFLHICTGPVFVLTWPLYSSSPAARFLAALLPGLMSLRFLLAGLGITREPRLVAGTARTGKRQELLRGPLLYGCAHVVLTLAFWRHNPAGVVAVAALCIGDGLADVGGRLFGRVALPHNKTKTWAGSAACALGSSIGSLLLLLFMRWCDLMLQEAGLSSIAGGCLLASVVAAAVESLPLKDIDNVLVPAAAAGVAAAWFAYAL